MRIAILAAGGGDVYYEMGLLSGLVSIGIKVDYIGSNVMKDKEILTNEQVSFYNLRGSQDPSASIGKKITRILKYYFRLFKFAFKTDSAIIHIQWFPKFVYFDRVLLNLYYKVLRKKLVFTAHNVNAGVRDGNDNIINRLTLRFMYKIVDHIIVHTKRMKQQLIDEFNIRDSKVTVVPYGINNMVFNSHLTATEAKKNFGLRDNDRVILFFGIIKTYKGLEDLLLALANLKKKADSIKLIIAGKIDRNYNIYWEELSRIIEENNLKDNIIERIEFIPDTEVEIYFKAADVLILPYKYIYQSGILFLSLTFGLPIIATDVGSLKEIIVEGKTGFVCSPQDPVDLAEKIAKYFQSDLYKNLDVNREEIIKYANEKYSWVKIAEKTFSIYKSLL
jgi:glycosyltransferase involved in cell wall biosynthesis